MIEDGYIFLVAIVVLASAIGGAFIIRRSLLSKVQPPQVCVNDFHTTAAEEEFK